MPNQRNKVVHTFPDTSGVTRKVSISASSRKTKDKSSTKPVKGGSTTGRKRFIGLVLILSLVSFGIGTAWYFNLVQTIIEADITRLSLVIAAVYAWFTGEMMVSAYKKDTKKCGKFEFVSDLLPSLGLLGTVAGLIIATSGPLKEALNNPSLIREVLASMSKGVSTALFTTGVGLVFSVLLKIQNKVLGGK